MRTYRNTKSGVIVYVESEVSGDWEEIISDPPKPAVPKPKRKRKENTINDSVRNTNRS